MARFSIGEKVRIAKRYPTLHHRVPNYVKGMVGEIERICEAFGQPEKLAVGESGEPLQTLYRVRLSQPSIWKDYDGNTQDTLEIEIFEHWLEELE